MIAGLRFHLYCLVLVCFAHLPVMAENDRILFDFSNPQAIEGWSSVNDGVMGGMSEGSLVTDASGSALFSGVVRLENNGGFSSVRSPEIQSFLEGTIGLLVRFRGDGNRYKVSLHPSSRLTGHSWQQTFETIPDHWQERFFPYNQFIPTFRGQVLTHIPPPVAGEIKTLGFLISDKQKGPFRLEIQWIRACSVNPENP